MADFTRWGCAIAMALGYKEEDFIRAYNEKVKTQIEEAAHAGPVATVLLNYLESKRLKEWEGTPSQLYKLLLDHTKEIGVSTHQKVWPKAPHVLVRQLNELMPSMKALDWEVTTGIKSGSTRKISVRSVPSVPSDNGQEEEDDSGDGRDAMPTDSSKPKISLEDLVSVYWSDSFSGEHECGVCSFRRMTSWQGETNKGDKVAVCESCQREFEKRRESV